MSAIYKDGKVLLAKFTSSEQMIADNTGKATSKVEDYWRVKTYVKPDDMLGSNYPVFPEPYKFGQDVIGGSWNDFNKPFIIQIAQCNIDCWYCFVDKKLRMGIETAEDGSQLGAWFTAEEVLDMWLESGSKVLRVSGGEPTLASRFLAELAALMEDEAGILWIDTNLTTGDALSDAVDAYEGELYYGMNVGVCGCFKGFTNQQAADITGSDIGLLDRQFKTAKSIIEGTPFEVFFYVPGIVPIEDASSDLVAEKDITNFFNRMREEVHEDAPLRTYILEVKNYSSTETENWGLYTGQVPGHGGIYRPIDVWNKLCRQHYPVEKLWIPGNQVPLRTPQWR